MKLSKFISSALLLPLLVACSNQRSDSTETQAEQSVEAVGAQTQPLTVTKIETPAGMVKNYVDSNEMIDLDLSGISQKLAQGASHSAAISYEEIAQAKAVVYRFFKHVSVKDNLYHCDLTDGAEINVSERVFNALKANLDEMNAQMKALQEQGKTYHMSAPSDEYFDKLLE